MLIQSSKSLISAGTERMLLDFGRSRWVAKAKQQPDKVRQVLDKVRTDGLMTTVEAVRSKLSDPVALGYCNVGRVIEVGPRVDGFAVGDRVVSNGSHAEYVVVPKNLAAKVPENVSDEEAAFTVLGAIALQGIRLAAPTLGEAIVVTGLGLIGLLAVQLLRAHGCRVLGIDLDSSKVELARQFGAEVVDLSKGGDPIAAAQAFSRGRGVDAVLIAASTKSSEPVHQAAQMCRKRGRIVLVGVTGLELSRADFYEKELTFQVSCSYGPGRYDPEYEENGHDYPIGFVRWTEQRNFEAVLDMMASGALDVKPLISHRFPFDRAPEAYDLLLKDRSVLGILLEYGGNDSGSLAVPERRVRLKPQSEARFDPQKPVVAFIGAGNYASRMLIPAFKEAGAQLHTIAASGGTSAGVQGRKHGFLYATTDVEDVFANEEINTVVVATRHDSHAQFVEKALRAGKNVFVEKPLAIRKEEVERLEGLLSELQAEGQSARLMVGFNRRFAPHVQKMKELLDAVHEPKTFVMVMNAGAITRSHWTQDPEVGGGRIIGEACHYVDLMRYLVGSQIVSVEAKCMGPHDGLEVRDDKAVLVLGFADGSFGTIHYLANGSPRFQKERIEVFAGGRVLQLNNFRELVGYGWPGFRRIKLWRQDKGQERCAQAFLHAVEEGAPSPIPAGELTEVARVTIHAAEILRGQ